MSQSPPQIDECQAGFAVSPMPVWVLDIDTLAFHWANDAALELWQADDRTELFARDMTTGIPERVAARVQDSLARVRTGEVFREPWAFYPKGKPQMLLLEMRPIVLPDGRIGMLNHALPITSEPDPALLRASSLAHHISLIGAFVDDEGNFLSCNSAAMLEFDGASSWLQWFVDPAVGRQLLHDVLCDTIALQSVERLAQMATPGGPRWHVIRAHALRDPVSGKRGVLVEHRDETARVEAQQIASDQGQHIDRLNAALELVERQRQEILQLSAPILAVGNRTLAVPLIGRIEQSQSDALSAKLMDIVANGGVERVVLDLTGTVELDDASARRLTELIQGLRLLGAKPVVTGVQPRVAWLLSQLDSGIGEVETQRSLAVVLANR